MATQTSFVTLIAADITAKKKVVAPANAPALGYAHREVKLSKMFGFERCASEPRVATVAGVTLEIYLAVNDKVGDKIWWTTEDA